MFPKKKLKKIPLDEAFLKAKKDEYFFSFLFLMRNDMFTIFL